MTSIIVYESLQVSSLASYTEALSVDVSVNGEGWGAKFSASTAYKEVKEGTAKSHNVYIESVAKCILYRANAKRKINLAEDFIQDVKDLPVGNNTLPDYLDFIDAYGTHYVSQVIMGAKAIQQNKFDESSITAMKVTMAKQNLF